AVPDADGFASLPDQALDVVHGRLVFLRPADWERCAEAVGIRVAGILEDNDVEPSRPVPRQIVEKIGDEHTVTRGWSGPFELRIVTHLLPEVDVIAAIGTGAGVHRHRWPAVRWIDLVAAIDRELDAAFRTYDIHLIAVQRHRHRPGGNDERLGDE